MEETGGHSGTQGETGDTGGLYRGQPTWDTCGHREDTGGHRGTHGTQWTQGPTYSGHMLTQEDTGGHMGTGTVSWPTYSPLLLGGQADTGGREGDAWCMGRRVV